LLVFVYLADLGGLTGVVFSTGFVSLDSLSFMLVILSVWVGVAGWFGFFGSGWFNFVGTSKSYSFVLGALVLCLILAFFSSSVLFFYLFFELSLVPILLIILGWGYQPERLQAGLYIMLYTLFASIPLLFSLVYVSSWLCSSSFVSLGLSSLYSGFLGG